MIRYFIVRAILAAIGGFLANAVVPAVATDGDIATFILFGLFMGAGEIIIHILRSGLALLFFIIPGMVRTFLIRIALVAISAGLVTGFAFGSPLVVGLVGTTILLTILFQLPFASSP